MYFERAGKQNTEQTLDVVKATIAEKGIKHVVVATTKGDTAKLFKDADLGVNLVCVTHVTGHEVPGELEVSQDLLKELKAAGVKVLTTTHVLSGVERGISRSVGGMYPAEIMSNALRMLGQGTKVCVEISIMALDAGLIPYGEDVIAVAGTNRGADTAVIIRPAHASRVFDTWISEFLCKPAQR
jgi:hypothetical protein